MRKIHIPLTVIRCAEIVLTAAPLSAKTVVTEFGEKMHREIQIPYYANIATNTATVHARNADG